MTETSGTTVTGITGTAMENNRHISKHQTAVLLFSVFIVGLCTIVYELMIGTVSAYFLGDSIKQFSITIGLAMSAMGLGTYLSRFVTNRLMHWFLRVEILLALVGGLSVPILYAVFAYAEQAYTPLMVSLILLIGLLIGLEIPLLTRILEKNYTLKLNISNVLSLDYFGALIATFLFPFFLLPFCGVFNSSLITGLLNLVVAGLVLYMFRHEFRSGHFARYRVNTACVGLLLLVGLIFSRQLVFGWEQSLFDDRILLSRQTPYQKIVLTRYKDDFRLFLDGNLQFSSMDEYRYHEALVHVPMAAAAGRRSVLILGGGDGLAVRELLKYPEIERITLVDLDPAVTDLARSHRLFRRLNGDSLNDPRVRVINRDAFGFLKDEAGMYDVIIADLPDPNNTSLARLYSREFYRLAGKRLAAGGVFVTQASSVWFAKDAFWCIAETLKAAGFKSVAPYHALVPSFGDWGYVLAGKRPVLPERLDVSVPTRYLNDRLLVELFTFPSDMRSVNVEVSSLDHPAVLDYYLAGWQHWK